MPPLARSGILILSVAGLCASAYAAGSFITSILRQPTDESSAPSIQRSIVEFFNSTDMDTRIEAVRATKAAFMQATTSLDRAHALNILVGMAHAVHEDYIYDEIFTGPPFDEFATKDKIRSLDNLARYSFKLYPTAYAAQLAAFEDRTAIYDTFQKRDTSFNVETVRKQLEPNFQRVLDAYDTAAKWIGHDVMDTKTPEEAVTTLVAFYQWQGHLLSDLAIGDQRYFDAAQRDLEKAILYAEAMRDSNGKTLSYLDSKIAEVQLSIASYSAERGKRYGEQEYIDRAHEYSEKLVRRLKAEPEKYNRFYTLLELERESQEAERRGHHIQHTEHQRETLRPFWRFKILATIDPTMKKFLLDYGLTLPEEQ